MFQDDYKKAYEKIVPSEECVNEILTMVNENSDTGNSENTERLKRGTKMKHGFGLRPLVAMLAVCVMLAGCGITVGAAYIPEIYKVIERISPKMADLFVPIQESCVRKDICMQVEAIHMEGREAEILVSFSDVGETDLIHGEVDLYDSYGLSSHKGIGTLGGCSFLEYDETSGKAYFKITMIAEKPYDKDKITFYTKMLLTEHSEEKREIDLNNVLSEVELKPVHLTGFGRNMPMEEELPEHLQPQQPQKTEDGEMPLDPRPVTYVMDLGDAKECSTDDITIMGIAYADGVLRLQICRGNEENACRYAFPYLKDASGEERPNNYTAGWTETDEAGNRRHFEEYWFVGPFENLEEYSLYGMLYRIEGDVQGDWKVTFRLEE